MTSASMTTAKSTGTAAEDRQSLSSLIPEPLPLSAVALSLTILIAAFSSAGYAAESGTTSAGPGDGSERTADVPAERTDKTRAASANDSKAEDEGGFTPSEEISEDFAVSFPVDI